MSAATTYRIEKLSNSRRRLSGTKEYFAGREYVARECDNCTMPFGFHAISYASESPFLIDNPAAAAMGRQGPMQIPVPGVVMDIECLPIDKRQIFQRQFINELRDWKAGQNGPLMRIFESMTMPQVVSPGASAPTIVNPPYEAAKKFQYLGEMNVGRGGPYPKQPPAADMARFVEAMRLEPYELADPQLAELIRMFVDNAPVASESQLQELAGVINARRKQLQLQERARSAQVQVAPAPESVDWFKKRAQMAADIQQAEAKLREYERQRAILADQIAKSAGPYDDAFYSAVIARVPEAGPQPEPAKKPAADVIEIGTKRKLFLDD